MMSLACDFCAYSDRHLPKNVADYRRREGVANDYISTYQREKSIDRFCIDSS